MTISEGFSTLISVLKLCQTIRWPTDDRSPSGEIHLSRGIFSDVSSLMDCAWISSCVSSDGQHATDASSAEKMIGQSITIEFQLPVPSEEVAIVRSIDALLGYGKFLTLVPENIFIIDAMSDIAPQKYKDSVSFASLLKIVADHVDESGSSATCFLYDGIKAVVPIKYKEKDMVTLDGLEILSKSFQKPRLKERIQIFKSSLVKFAISSPSESLMFSHLLSNFSQIKNTFEQDWNLYVSDFSMDDVLEELKEKILKVSDKLTNSLSDLQKTMIAIPLAIIFAAPKVDTAGVQTWSNGLILASVWIFGVFTWAFFSSHIKTLGFIRTEVEDIKDFVKSKHATMASALETKFEDLDKRCKFQREYIRVVGSVMWLIAIAFTIVFFLPQLEKLYTKIISLL